MIDTIQSISREFSASYQTVVILPEGIYVEDLNPHDSVDEMEDISYPDDVHHDSDKCETSIGELIERHSLSIESNLPIHRFSLLTRACQSFFSRDSWPRLQRPRIVQALWLVIQAGLGDTLDNPEALFTVFAPSNDAFANHECYQLGRPWCCFNNQLRCPAGPPVCNRKPSGGSYGYGNGNGNGNGYGNNQYGHPRQRKALPRIKETQKHK